MRARCWLLLLAGAPGCSTLAEAGGGEDNLPNAGAGPFREIDNEELGAGRAAPYVLRDDDDFPRDPAILDADGDLATLEAWAYVPHTVFAEGEEPDAARPPNEIIRQIARDGRSFAREFEVVLTPAEAWEMGTIGRPAVLRHDGVIWLYYAAAGGIGVATSSDGVSFSRPSAEPVLAPGDGWEAGVAPTSPCVLASADGSLRMYYEVPLASGSAIGVATSSDGVSFRRVGDRPVLAPRAGEIDAGGAAAPFALSASSAEGRAIEYLYYAATDAEAKRTIAMVARYGATGDFQHASAPVFGTTGSLAPTEPLVVRYPGYALLFVTQRAGSTGALDYPAVAAGVAPADVRLPDPL